MRVAIAIRRLFRVLSLSHMRREAFRTALTVAGVGLGIAAFTAITTAMDSAERSFGVVADLFGDRDAVALRNPEGRVSELLIQELYRSFTGGAIVPISKRTAEVSPGKRVTVVGTDLLTLHPILAPDSDPLALLRGGALLSPDLLEHGPSLTLEGHSLTTVYSTRDSPPRSIFLDIGTYQEIFRDFGAVDEIHLTSRSVGREEIRRWASPYLSHSLAIVEPSEQRAQAETMTEAFRLNLYFLTAVTLFVSLALIYNAASASVFRRRSEFALLRSLGASPRFLLLFLICEAALIGFIASCIGLSLGYFFSRYTVSAIGETISNLYVPLNDLKPTLSAKRVLQILLLGPAVTVLGFLIPAVEVLLAGAREAFAYSTLELRFREWVNWFAALGVLLLLLCGFATHESVLQRGALFGFLPVILLLCGSLLLIPKLLLLFIRLPQGLAGKLAADHIGTSLYRNSVAVGGMTVALSLFVGMSVMVLSFRGTVESWIQQITAADLYVSRGGRGGGEIPRATAEKLIRLSGVQNYDWVATRELIRDRRRILVHGVRFSVIADTGRLLLQQPMTQTELHAAFAIPNPVLVSETYARRFGVRMGDPLELLGWKGKIVNIFFDYSSDQGVIFIPDTVFAALYQEEDKNGVSLFLADGVSVKEIVQDIELQFADHRFQILESEILRSHVLQIFDRTFAITRALQLVAFGICALTTVTVFSVLTLERMREFGILRAIGASGWTLRRLIGGEALMIGIFSACLAAIIGLALAVLLIFVINRHFFGWSINFVFPAGMVLFPLVIAVLLAPLLALGSNMAFVRTLDSRVLRYE